MSKNEVSENLISHYLEPKKKKPASLKSFNASKKTGQTLNDFYAEIQSQKKSYGIENVYYGKNAHDIELMMMRNRKLIEDNYTKR